MFTTKLFVVVPAPALTIWPVAWNASPHWRFGSVLKAAGLRSGRVDVAVAVVESSCRPSSGSNRRIIGPRPQARRRAAARRWSVGMSLLLPEKIDAVEPGMPRPVRTGLDQTRFVHRRRRVPRNRAHLGLS